MDECQGGKCDPEEGQNRERPALAQGVGAVDKFGGDDVLPIGEADHLLALEVDIIKGPHSHD